MKVIILYLGIVIVCISLLLKETKQESGLKVYTDEHSGCQYLSVGPGSLTPRLDEAGKPYCYKPHERNKPNA